MMEKQLKQFLTNIGEEKNEYVITKITSSPRTRFENGKPVSVDLEGLGILVLYPEMLKPLAETEQLYLGDNLIEYLPEGLFEAFANLKKLDLSRNPIYTFHPKAFKGLENLQRLNLSETQIFTFPIKTLEDMPNLKSIDLTKTKLPKSLQQVHTDIEALKTMLQQTKFQKKVPSRLDFWHSIRASYIGIFALLSIPVLALTAGLPTFTPLLILFAYLCFLVDFGIIKRNQTSESTSS